MAKAFDWLEYVSLADELMLNDKESHHRSAVSRAYYGVFCKIREKLERDGIYFPDPILILIFSLKSPDSVCVYKIG